MATQVNRSDTVSQTISFTHDRAPVDCGNYIVTVDSVTPVYDHTQFLVIAGMRLDVKSTSNADLGSHSIVLLVKMVTYPEPSL